MRPSRFFFAARTVRAEIPASAAAFSISSLASSFPSASKSKISYSACSVFVAVLPPAPDSSSSAVISYSPTHSKPVSGSRQKAMGFPSGAREDLSWIITRTFGSRFTRPISRTLRNISKAAKDRAHFILLVHVGFLAHICLYGVKDNQPRPVLDDSLPLSSLCFAFDLFHFRCHIFSGYLLIFPINFWERY